MNKRFLIDFKTRMRKTLNYTLNYHNLILMVGLRAGRDAVVVLMCSRRLCHFAIKSFIVSKGGVKLSNLEIVVNI